MPVAGVSTSGSGGRVALEGRLARRSGRRTSHMNVNLSFTLAVFGSRLRVATMAATPTALMEVSA